MTCPVCESYGQLNGAIDRAGREYHEAMAEIREKEADGQRIGRLVDVSSQLSREAARTDVALGFSVV